MLVSNAGTALLAQLFNNSPAPSPARPSPRLYHYPPLMELEKGGMDTAERERTA